jgi:uncharacterized Zn-finger protein
MTSAARRVAPDGAREDICPVWPDRPVPPIFPPANTQGIAMRDARQTGYTPVQLPGVTPEEMITVESRTVGCDGGGGALGHPLVYLRIEDRQVTCPYCSRTYVLAEGAGDGDNH